MLQKEQKFTVIAVRKKGEVERASIVFSNTEHAHSVDVNHSLVEL